MCAEGKGEVARIVESVRLESGLEVLGVIVSEVCGEGDVAECLGAIGRATNEVTSAFGNDILGCGLEKMRGDPLRLVRDLDEGIVNCRAADRGAATAVGAHPELHRAGVTVHDLDVLHGDSQFMRHELCERRLMALSVRM